MPSRLGLLLRQPWRRVIGWRRCAGSKPERYVTKQAADADGLRKKLTDKQLFAWYTHELFHRFCAVHGVHALPQYKTLGTPRRTRHACKIHLPLPRELQAAFGFQRLIRSGEVQATKTEAFFSAKETILRSLRDEGKVNLHELLRDERRAPTTARRQPYDETELRLMVRNAPEAVQDKAADATLDVALLSRAWPVFTRHKTLSKKRGVVLQVNVRCHPHDASSFVEISTKSERDGADYNAMELEALLNLPRLLRRRAGKVALSELDRIREEISTDVVQTRIHAELFFDSNVLRQLPSSSSSDGGNDRRPRYSYVPSMRQTTGMLAPLRLSAASTILPISKIREELQTYMKSTRLSVIEGGAGCGKTTQVPKYLLDSTDDQIVSVLVVQPRRLAAVASAQRVAAELGESVGETVGYSIYLESRRPRRVDRSIEFATAGLVLARVARDPELSGVTHIVFDEHHERNADADLLLAMVKDNPRFKIVVMSATLQTDALLKYLGVNRCFRVPLGTNFAVGTKFLDDVPISRSHKNALRSTLVDDTDVVPEELVELICHASADAIGRYAKQRADTTQKAVLCFLPGWTEIERVAELLQDHLHECFVYRLHSSVSLAKQQKALEPVRSDKMKVVLATDIAETSLTVPDITLVVDSGLCKTMRYSPTSRVSTLRVETASKAAAKQRLGRVGRVGPGECWRLYSEAQYAEMMPDHVTPELGRTNLESHVLRAATLSQPDLFSRTLDPPPENTVAAATRRLISLRALRSPTDATTTQLGDVLVHLPIDPVLGRALLLGVALGVADDAAAIVALAATPRALDVLLRNANLCRDESGAIYTSDVVRALDSFAASPTSSNIAREISRAKADLLNRIGGFRAVVSDRHFPDGDHRLAVLTCVVCAAFRANLAHAQASRRPRWHCATRTQAKVRLDSSSINARKLANSGQGLWFVFGDALGTSSQGTRLTHTTRLTPLQLALFGGDSHLLSENLGIVLLDQWVVARPLSESDTACLVTARHAIDAALHDIVAGRHPDSTFLDALVATLANDLKANLDRDEVGAREQADEDTDIIRAELVPHSKLKAHKDDPGMYELTIADRHLRAGSRNQKSRNYKDAQSTWREKDRLLPRR